MSETERPRLTLRVSRDSGQTYGPAREYGPADVQTPLLTTTWPPCRCERCKRD
jgi:hypothetical protein